jgi:hypothetical protein
VDPSPESVVVGAGSDAWVGSCVGISVVDPPEVCEPVGSAGVVVGFEDGGFVTGLVVGGLVVVAGLLLDRVVVRVEVGRRVDRVVVTAGFPVEVRARVPEPPTARVELAPPSVSGTDDPGSSRSTGTDVAGVESTLSAGPEVGCRDPSATDRTRVP